MSANNIFPVHRLNHDLLSDSSGILIINADKIPPHLGIYSTSKYFSVSVNDVHIGNSIEVIIQYIHRKRIPTIFIRLKEEFNENDLIETFNSFQKLSGQCTCIQPIKEMFKSKVPEASKAMFIFELIPILRSNGWVKSYHHLYADELLIDKSFSLRTYSMDDVMGRINLLINGKE